MQYFVLCEMPGHPLKAKLQGCFAGFPEKRCPSQYVSLLFRHIQLAFMKNRYVWSKLNRQQIGAFCEYFVKMELTMHGLQVYGTEVDDRGVDFVARYERGPFLEIQVKSLRSLGYVFMQKDKFPISESTWLALGLLFEGTAPQLFLVPSIAWRSPNALFADRNYEKEGLKSPPEWGLNISNKNMSLLEPFRFDYMLEKLQGSN